MKPGRANKNGLLGTNQIGNRLQKQCGRFCNPRATGRQTATTMRANCKHDPSQPGLLIWEGSRRSGCNFRQPTAHKHIANPVCWAVKNRDSHIPDAYFCVLCCGVHLFRASTTHARRPVDWHTCRQFLPNNHHPHKTTTNQSTNKGIVRMHPAQPSRDTRLWICSMGCKWEVNGIGIGGHYG